MPTVNTVLGPVDVNDLGFTLMHEHIRESSAGVPFTFPELVEREGAIARGVGMLRDAAAEGVRTFVDVTTMDLGRQITVIREVAEQVEVHIIAATGLWLDVPRAIGLGTTPEQLAVPFIREIEVGIEGTGIRAGVIKVATGDQGVTPANEIVLRAAAKASNATGAPISTHTAALAKVGNDQVAIFEDEGVDLSRVYIGHSNDTDDLDYLSGLVRKGCILGLDHYPGGRMGGLDWEQRTAVVKRLIDLGFAESITLSHDFGDSRPALPEVIEQRRAYNPDSISFISRRVLPRLRDLGVSENAIQTMMVDVPRRFFGGLAHGFLNEP